MCVCVCVGEFVFPNNNVYIIILITELTSDLLIISSAGFNGKFYDKNMMNIFAREVVKFLWEYIVEEFEEKEMLEFIKYPTRLLHDATRAENVEFLIILINLYPDIVWEEDDEGKTIFDVAIENRLENVFNLIDEIGGLNEFAMKHRLTNRNYSMLHTVANLATPNNLNRVTGAAFQMQRELLWFKVTCFRKLFFFYSC